MAITAATISATTTVASGARAASAAFKVNPSPSPPISTRARRFPFKCAHANSASCSSEPCWRVDMSVAPSTRIAYSPSCSWSEMVLPSAVSVLSSAVHFFTSEP